jgi:hypothetical protein
MKLADYLSLPLYQRETTPWFWPTGWYTYPDNTDENETSLFNNFYREIYPQQYFLRAKVFPKIVGVLMSLRFFPTP